MSKLAFPLFASLAVSAFGLSDPIVNWRVGSSFPPGLIIHGSAQVAADIVSELSQGKFKLEVFDGAGTSAAINVGDGDYEACHTSGNYLAAVEPAFAAGASLPFLLTARGFNAWHYYGGGIEAYNSFLDSKTLVGFPCGNTGVQMAGWFNKEIKSVADFKGLKMRIGGLGARIAEKLGVIVQNVPASEIYACLKNGTLDAAEFVGPYDDYQLKLHEVAKYYYHPGWMEPSATMHFMINKAAWNNLPQKYKDILKIALRIADADMLQKYDYNNPASLEVLKSKRVAIKTFSTQVLNALYSATTNLYSELASGNEAFSNLYNSVRAFNEPHLAWKQISDYSYDQYLLEHNAYASTGPKEGTEEGTECPQGQAAGTPIWSYAVIAVLAVLCVALGVAVALLFRLKSKETGALASQEYNPEPFGAHCTPFQTNTPATPGATEILSSAHIL